MFPLDYIGYFIKEHHQSNFTYLITQLYPNIEQEYFNKVLPENELSFLFLVSVIFEDIPSYEGESLDDYFDKIIEQGTYLDKNDQKALSIAIDFLNSEVHINFKNLPHTYGIEIKNALDILQSTNDLVKFTQYEVVAIAIKELELQKEMLYINDFER